MNFLGVHVYPDLLEESWRELERERQRAQQIREARAVQRAARPSLFARRRRSVRPAPCVPAVQGC